MEKEIRNGMSDDLGEKERRLTVIDTDISNLIKEKERVATMFQKGLVDEMSAEKRLREVNIKNNTLLQLQQSLFNEIKAYKLSNKEIDRIKDIANKVIDILDKLEFKERYYIVKLLIEEIIVTSEAVIIKAKIPTLIQNVDI